MCLNRFKYFTNSFTYLLFSYLYYNLQLRTKYKFTRRFISKDEEVYLPGGLGPSGMTVFIRSGQEEERHCLKNIKDHKMYGFVKSSKLNDWINIIKATYCDIIKQKCVKWKECYGSQRIVQENKLRCYLAKKS